MADRFLFKKFAGETAEVGQFGSFQAGGGKVGDGVLTTDPDAIQALQAWGQGWGSAVDKGLLLPRLEELNGVQRVFAEMLYNQWRDGITFWQAGAPVKALQSVVLYQAGDGLPALYLNTTGTNGTNPPPQDVENWRLVFTVGDIQTVANMEQAISGAADKYPSSKAVKDYTSNFDVKSENFTSHISKFPVNYSMSLEVASYNQYKPYLDDNDEAIYPIGKNSTLVIGSTFTYGENTGTIKDITTDADGRSFAKIKWSTNNYYADAVTAASTFVLLKDGGQLVSIDISSKRTLLYRETAPTQSTDYNSLIYWYDTTNNLMKKSVDYGATWTDCYASFPLASFGTSKDSGGNISVTSCYFCYSVSFMEGYAICLPFGEITGIFGTNSFNRETRKVPTLFKSLKVLGLVSNNTSNGHSIGAKLSRKGSTSNRVYTMGALDTFSSFSNYGLSTNVGTFDLQNGSLQSNGIAGASPTDFCPLGRFYVKNDGLYDVWVTGVDCFQPRLNAPMQPIVQETYHFGTSWYRIWSDGWIEQGGIVTPAALSTVYAVNFIKPFRAIILNMRLQDKYFYAQGMSNSTINPISLTQFHYETGNPAQAKQDMFWYACGY